MHNKLFLTQLVHAGLRYYYQHKPFWRYLVGGGLITFINLGLYSALVGMLMPVRWANLFALTAAKMSGFFINKYYVYQTKTTNLRSTGSEVWKYTLTRGLTGVFDYIAVLVLVEFLSFPVLLTKYVVTGVVIIANYILMKYVVFTSVVNSGVEVSK